MEHPANHTLCRIQHSIVYTDQLGHVMDGLVVKPQTTQSTLAKLGRYIGVTVEMPTPLILGITGRLPNIVEKERQLYCDVLAGILTD